jgi:hypothetical protein
LKARFFSCRAGPARQEKAPGDASSKVEVCGPLDPFSVALPITHFTKPNTVVKLPNFPDFKHQDRKQ